MTAREWFEKTLPGTLAKVAGKFAGANIVYQFVITGEGGGTWSLRLKDTYELVEEPTPNANCTLTMDANDWVDMVTGKLNPQMAFMSGKIKIDGDMSLALKLGSFLQ